MKPSERLQILYDWCRPNRYELKKYLVDDGEKHPFAIICPGGSYRIICSYVGGRPVAKALNEQGYHAFVVYYRTKKKARYPHPQEDLKRAIGEILDRADKWKLEMDGWSLWGSSAGGHMVASYCIEDWGTPRPAALILTYPVITLGEKTHIETRDHLLGKDADPKMISKLSVERHITAAFPPTFVWNGEADDIVDPINSRMLEKALKEAGVVHKAETFEGVGHGIGLAKGTVAEGWFDDAVAFWEEQRKGC